MVAPSPQFLRSNHAVGRSNPALAQPVARPEAPEILGRVRFRTHRGEPAEAILDAQGTWSCPRLPVLDRVLNALFAPDLAQHDAAAGKPS